MALEELQKITNVSIAVFCHGSFVIRKLHSYIVVSRLSLLLSSLLGEVYELRDNFELGKRKPTSSINK